MPTYPVISIVDGEPTFAEKNTVEKIVSNLKVGGALQTLSPLEHHTDRQRRWYKGICLTGLSDWSGDTKDEWDLKLKALCNGIELLKKETIYLGPGTECIRLTIVGVGKRNLTAFIENILSKSIEMDWPVTAPDPDLRASTSTGTKHNDTK